MNVTEIVNEVAVDLVNVVVELSFWKKT